MIIEVVVGLIGLVAVLFWLRARGKRIDDGHQPRGTSLTQSHARQTQHSAAPVSLGTVPVEASANTPPPLAVKGSNKKSTLAGAYSVNRERRWARSSLFSLTRDPHSRLQPERRVHRGYIGRPHSHNQGFTLQGRGIRACAAQDDGTARVVG